MTGLGVRPIKKPWFKKYIREYWQLYVLIAPAIIFFAVFSYYPMYGAQIAFRQYSAPRGITGSDWVGLKHFIRFVTEPWFKILLNNTLTFSFYSLVAGFPIPLILSFLINEVRSKPFQKSVQMITYAPHFLSNVIVCGMIVMFFRIEIGMVNNILKFMGQNQIDFLIKPAIFKHLYVWSGIWQRAGWGTIIYLASLSAVDQEVIEASIIDGCSRFQKIIHIDFPTIQPTIVINLLLSLGAVLASDTEKIILLQREVTKMASETFGSFLYYQGIINSQFSYTTAAGMFNNVINLLLLSLFNWIARRLGETALW